jgi:hypothetical protein
LCYFYQRCSFKEQNLKVASRSPGGSKTIKLINNNNDPFNLINPCSDLSSLGNKRLNEIISNSCKKATSVMHILTESSEAEDYADADDVNAKAKENVFKHTSKHTEFEENQKNNHFSAFLYSKSMNKSIANIIGNPSRCNGNKINII